MGKIFVPHNPYVETRKTMPKGWNFEVESEEVVNSDRLGHEGVGICITGE